MISVKSIADPINKLDGRRILITRYHPRNLETGGKIYLPSLDITVWIKELSPSHELIQKRKSKQITKNQFKELFKQELMSELNKEKTESCLRTIKSMEFYDDNVVLLTFPLDIHGSIVKQMVLDTKIQVVIDGNVASI